MIMTIPIVFLIIGLGCDTSRVIQILAHRNAEQRSLIQQEYETTYSEPLSKRISSQIHGHVKVNTRIYMVQFELLSAQLTNSSSI